MNTGNESDKPGWFRFIKQVMQAAFSKKTLDSIGNGVTNTWNRYTGSALTDADIQANEMTMQNQEDIFQRQVTGMQKAGLNPALMYGSSPSSAPAAQNTSGSAGVNMSDLIQAMMIPLQKRLLSAQTDNVKADTDKKKAETGESSARTEQIRLLMDWYPRLTETQIRDMSTHADLNVGSLSKVEVEKEIAEAEKFIRQAEADESSAYFKARREAEQAKDDESLASAAAHLASAAWQQYETSYTKSHGGARPASSSILALANAIATSLKDVGKSFSDALSGAFPGLFSSSDDGSSENPFPKGSPQWLGYEAARKHSRNGGSR